MRSSRLRRTVGALGLYAALATALLPPLGFAVEEYVEAEETLELRGGLIAGRLSRYIFEKGALWEYHQVRFADLLELPPEAQREGGLAQRVIGTKERTVVEMGRESVSAPTLTRAVPIMVRGEAVGRLELTTSLRPLLKDVGQVGFVSLILALFVYYAFRVIPLRALDRTMAALADTEEGLREKNMLFDAALTNMPHGLCMFDGDKRLVLSNAPYAAMYNLPPEATRTGTSQQTILEHRTRLGNAPVDPEAYVAKQAQMTERGGLSTFRWPLADGRIVRIGYQNKPNGGFVASHEDITEAIRAEEQITHMAHHDALTGLPNRILFRDGLEQALADAERDGNQFAVLCLDLDHFKNVNDSLGHPVGDALLKTVAERLKACMRDTDRVARLGGDEFAIVQVGITGPEPVTALAQRTIEALGAPFELDSHQIMIGTSVGVALAPGDASDADQLLKCADMALYRAKADGRGACRFFEPEMDARMQARRALETDLRQALARNEFEVYYQPLVDLAANRVSGFEALLRWHHPTRGMVSPAEFIPLCEEIGLIGSIGGWVLRTACSEAATWPAGTKVAVNLSPLQFKNSALVLEVVAALGASGLAPNRLELEITETAMLADTDATLAVLHQLRDLGVRISMDDFGTGYSSLSYLRKFPFDKIKIDQSFVRDLSETSDSLAIVRAVTGLGHSLGMVTTAEGVETLERLVQLEAEGCTEVQGYLFSRPRPASAIADMMNTCVRGRLGVNAA